MGDVTAVLEQLRQGLVREAPRWVGTMRLWAAAAAAGVHPEFG